MNTSLMQYIKNSKVPLTLAATGLLFLTAPSFANDKTAQSTLLNVQHQWAQCQYGSENDDIKESCLEALVDSTQTLSTQSPQNTELKVWLAINKSTLAGAKGGLGALSLVKESKVLLEQAIKENPTVLDGSAYTSLGSLYYQVPGWPLAFGDDDTAEKWLKQALSINPDGIDPNYFYADFLLQDGRTAEARRYFIHAKQAAPRPDRPLADKGRQREIAQKMKEL